MKRFMKMIKNLSITFVVACACLLFAGTHVSAAEDAELFRYGRYALSQMEDGEDFVYAYDQLVQVCLEGEETYISVKDQDHEVTIDDFEIVFAMFRDDYPEYFWLTGAYSYYSSGNYVSSAMPYYTMTGETLEQAKKDFANAAAGLLEGLDGKSDYEKSLLLHDRLAYLVEYNFSENNQNAYGALVENECVCAGYARSYQYLLNQVGIPAWTVTGVSINPGSGQPEGHAWNLVQVDGKWYYSDVTWDDQGDDPDEVYHAYLNVTEDVISEQHVLKGMYDGVMPEADSLEANYFYRNGGLLEEFDLDAVASLMKAGNGNANVFITGDVDTFLQLYFDNIIEIATKIGVTGGFSYGYSIMGREVALYITWTQSEKPSHTYGVLNVKKEPTCKIIGMKAHYYCQKCGTYFDTDKNPVSYADLVIPATGNHKFVEVIDKEPTVDEVGLKHEECTVCGAKQKEGTEIEKLPAPEPEPKPEPKPEPEPETKPTPKPEIKPTPKPVVKMPTPTSLKKVTAGKKKITIKWKKQTNYVDGYEIQLATNKKFTKGAKLKTVAGAKKVSLTVKKLKSKKTYYVRIRTYKVVNGKKIYSGWSKKILKVKVK